MAFADAVTYNSVRGMKGFPVGTILPWASDVSRVPTGWIPCNGSTYENTKYPLLEECIGNIYGGTPGSTFKIPGLTNSPKAIVDVHPGHFSMLSSGIGGNGSDQYSSSLTGGAPHRPENPTIATDAWWSLIGDGAKNDEGSNTQQNWTSTIDLVGEIVSPPNFLATYDEITMPEGTYFATAVYGSFTLRDYHLFMHSHGVNGESLGDDKSLSYQRAGGRAVRCSGRWSVGSCTMSCERTQCLRVRSGRFAVANNSDDLGREFGRWSTPAGGGGSVRFVPGGQTASGGYFPGTGNCSFDMTCRQYSGDDEITWTSLSNPERKASDVSSHNHSANQFDFKSNIGVVAPGLQDNVQINNVSLQNSAGLNFGTILADTTTPSLNMLFIIKAY